MRCSTVSLKRSALRESLTPRFRSPYLSLSVAGFATKVDGRNSRTSGGTI